MHDLFTHHRDRVDEIVSKLGKLDAHGAMVALRGDIVALDLLDHRDTFGRVWPSLLRGYAMDAVLEGPAGARRLTGTVARRRLHGLVEKAVLTAHSVPGVGEYYSVRGPRIAGGVATHQGRAVHVALFPTLTKLATKARVSED